MSPFAAINTLQITSFGADAPTFFGTAQDIVPEDSRSVVVDSRVHPGGPRGSSNHDTAGSGYAPVVHEYDTFERGFLM